MRLSLKWRLSFHSRCGIFFIKHERSTLPANFSIDFKPTAIHWDCTLFIIA